MVVGSGPLHPVFVSIGNRHSAIVSCCWFVWIMAVSLNLRVVTAAVPFPLKPSSSAIMNMALNPKPNLSFSSSVSANTDNHPKQGNRKLPILLFDIMDTIVRDPFYHDVPPFFGMPFKQLIECKDPTAWFDFEKGMIDELELAKKFFKDGRPIELEGLKDCMRRGYAYLDGVEELLIALKENNYEMHAFTNYPIWFNMIEEKLHLSKYLSWTFCSCFSGKRKPHPDFYLEVLRHLNVDPASCVFIDDRVGNIIAANEAGIVGLHFKNAKMLREDLIRIGVDIFLPEHERSDDQPKLTNECS